MDVVTAIERSGGLATRAALIRATSRADVDRALARAAVVRLGHGRYAPGFDEAAAVAFRLNGHLALTSAAVHHGWEVKTVPTLPHVAFPRKRNVPLSARRDVVIHRVDLGPDDVSGIATGRELTLLQCLRSLPDDEALAVADSALRHGEITLRRVLSSDHYWACPDLVDPERRIVIECDSYEWHGNRKGFVKDLRRYTLLSAAGWMVLRFTWDDVMLRPDWVREVLRRAVGVDARTELVAAWPLAA